MVDFIIMCLIKETFQKSYKLSNIRSSSAGDMSFAGCW